MSESSSAVTDKYSEGQSVRELVVSVAGPRRWNDTRESWLDRAAERAGISFRQAKALFYGEITDENHKAARLMRDAADLVAAEAVASPTALAGRFEEIARAMERADASFYRSEIDQLISVAGRLRGKAGPGDDRA